MSDPALMFELVRGGRVDLGSLQWLAAGFALYDRHDGQLPLERCLGLPSRSKRRLAQRDYFLIEAAKLVDGASPDQRAKALGAQIDAFMRGTWREWQRLNDPPAGTSELRRQLHYLAHTLSGKKRPSDKRIEQLVRRHLETFAAGSFHAER